MGWIWMEVDQRMDCLVASYIDWWRDRLMQIVEYPCDQWLSQKAGGNLCIIDLSTAILISHWYPRKFWFEKTFIAFVFFILFSGGRKYQKKTGSFNGLLVASLASLETFEPTTVLEDQHSVVVHLLAACRNSCWPSPCSPVIRAPIYIQHAHNCDVSSTNLNEFLPVFSLISSKNIPKPRSW